jgi:hypothetical protein
MVIMWTLTVMLKSHKTNLVVKYMLTQVLECICPDAPYTSNGTWESVVFDDENFEKPCDELYEYGVYMVTNVEALKKFREERNALLDKSDKYTNLDYPHNSELDKQNWIEYRQDLRDLSRTARPTLDEDGNLKDVEWPVIPSK